MSTAAGVSECIYTATSSVTGVIGFTWTIPNNAVLVSGSLTGNTSSIRLSFTNTGNGKVIVKTISPCGNSAVVTINTVPRIAALVSRIASKTTPVAAIAIETKASIYPNPGDGTYTFRIETPDKVSNAEV